MNKTSFTWFNFKKIMDVPIVTVAATALVSLATGYFIGKFTVSKVT